MIDIDNSPRNFQIIEAQIKLTYIETIGWRCNCSISAQPNEANFDVFVFVYSVAGKSVDLLYLLLLRQKVL